MENGTTHLTVARLIEIAKILDRDVREFFITEENDEQSDTSTVDSKLTDLYNKTSKLHHKIEDKYEKTMELLEKEIAGLRELVRKNK